VASSFFPMPNIWVGLAEESSRDLAALISQLDQVQLSSTFCVVASLITAFPGNLKLQIADQLVAGAFLHSSSTGLWESERVGDTKRKIGTGNRDIVEKKPNVAVIECIQQVLMLKGRDYFLVSRRWLVLSAIYLSTEQSTKTTFCCSFLITFYSLLIA
jgi:hypothetical protein